MSYSTQTSQGQTNITHLATQYLHTTSGHWCLFSPPINRITESAGLEKTSEIIKSNLNDHGTLIILLGKGFVFCVLVRPWVNDRWPPGAANWIKGHKLPWFGKGNSLWEKTNWHTELWSTSPSRQVWMIKQWAELLLIDALLCWEGFFSGSITLLVWESKTRGEAWLMHLRHKTIMFYGLQVTHC